MRGFDVVFIFGCGAIVGLLLAHLLDSFGLFVFRCCQAMGGGS